MLCAYLSLRLTNTSDCQGVIIGAFTVQSDPVQSMARVTGLCNQANMLINSREWTQWTNSFIFESVMLVRQSSKTLFRITLNCFKDCFFTSKTLIYTSLPVLYSMAFFLSNSNCKNLFRLDRKSVV